MENKIEFDSTFDYKLIYVFRINDKEHSDCVKIGDATIHTNKSYKSFFPNCSELNHAARKRIDEYTATAGIHYDLLYTEIAVYFKDGKKKAFRDYKVHEVLKRSGIKVKYFDTNKTQNERFICDLETAKNAINAVKEEKISLKPGQTSNFKNPIVFRPEQREAIKKTLKQFKAGKNRMLWNAKMRFGKTLTALEVVKELGFKKTIIITHRPVVDGGWFEDFQKIFYEDNTQYRYGSKNNGEHINNLLKGNDPFVYFASIQDLRGSAAVGGNFDKNNEVFNTDWDFIIIDEAHEGTQTELGKSVLEELLKGHEDYTKVLELSGTPFNLLSDFEKDNIYTWDYIMEQEAKMLWNQFHFGDSNPYAELPKLNIFTYHLEKSLPAYIDVMDKAFNFKEFFRTWTGDKLKDGKTMPSDTSVGDFVHEQDIKAFLDLICKEDEKTNYPFSTETYRNFFNHSLWIVPGVKEAKALSKLLKNHHIFEHFEIVNVAGDGDEEIDSSNALNVLKKAMTDHPEDKKTITLSCGRLTTGVTVPEWTAVLYLAGSYSTAASQYLQTIFRVQSPANIDGKMKENCFVFDFAPDRTLKMVAESVQLSIRAGVKNSTTSEANLSSFLNYCPVISIDGSIMKEFRTEDLLQQLKQAYIERVQRNGFDDPHIYNDSLWKLDDEEIMDLNQLDENIGKANRTKKVNIIEINNEGFSEEERDKIEQLEKKPKKELTPEEKAFLEEKTKRRERRKKAITILRGISIRMPLLVYGMNIDIKSDVTIDNFTDLIDDNSWVEFMPKKVTKEIFKKFSRYYDKDIFVGAARRIRAIAKTADELEPTERVKEIAGLFATFKNPDKETVLTPWRVVNMHMPDTIGGYDFFDEQHENTLDEPRFVDQGEVTKEVFNKSSKILEINSKTGLYPLYVTYSLYREFLMDIPEQEQAFERKLSLWDEVVTKHIYVICKTDMAKQITRRTLLGYRNGKINAHAFDDLIMQMKEKQDQLVKKIKNPLFWGLKEAGEMKFNAVVGNPPYQGTNHSQIYPFFYLSAIKLGESVSLIFPVGWQEPKNANNLSKMNVKEIKEDKQIVFINNCQNVFPGISGAEWVNIILWRKGYDNGLNGEQLFYTNGIDPLNKQLRTENDGNEKPQEIIELYKFVKTCGQYDSLQSITSISKPYGLRKDAFGNWEKYKLAPFNEEKKSSTDITIYASNGRIMYVPSNYPLPRKTKAFAKYKVFVGSAWGNMSEGAGLGGAYADVILGKPYDICTETYQESGCFDDEVTAFKHAKYLLTKFCRALIYVNKISQMTTNAWGAVPVQDYHEEWWGLSIAEIDKKLFEKYKVPQNIIDYCMKNIQTKSIANIVEFKEKK